MALGSCCFWGSPRVFPGGCEQLMPHILRCRRDPQHAGGPCLILLRYYDPKRLRTVWMRVVLRDEVREFVLGSALSASTAAGVANPAPTRCFAWLPHALDLPLLLLATTITTCCSTREGVVSDTLVVLQLLPSLELYFGRKHSFASIRSINFQDVLFQYRRLNAFQSE